MRESDGKERVKFNLLRSSAHSESVTMVLSCSCFLFAKLQYFENFDHRFAIIFLNDDQNKGTQN